MYNNLHHSMYIDNLNSNPKDHKSYDSLCDNILNDVPTPSIPIGSVRIPKPNIIDKLGTSPHHDEMVIIRANELKKINTRRLSKWVDDSSVSKCFKCLKDFSLFVRRHHCRICGRIFCYNCSNYFTTIPHDIISKIPKNPKASNIQERVCGECYTQNNTLLRIHYIIKVFELVQLTISDLNICAQVSVAWKGASHFCLGVFRDIQYKLSIEELTEQEKNKLWINREYLSGHSRWIIQLIKSIKLADTMYVDILKNIIYAKKKVSCWETMCTRFCSDKIEINDILDLIRYNNNYPIISEIIINCLNKTDIHILKNYIPFIVYYLSGNIGIFDAVIEKSILDFAFTSNLYWSILVYYQESDIKQYIIKLLSCIRNSTSPEYVEHFREHARMTCIDINLLHILNEKKYIILPICTDILFKKVDDRSIRIMSSFSKPFIIDFIDMQNVRKKIMFKNDDVRKDHVILNIINIIHTILKNEEPDLDIEIVGYQVTPTSATTGYIEIVENADTIFNIIEIHGVSVQNYILNNNKTETIGKFRDRFIKSTALYCIISYLFGFGDRHLDNIMISRDGLLFHIDFGYILGQDPKYTNNRMLRVTPEIVNVIGGYGTPDYLYFKATCIKIYNRLRIHVNLFSNLLSIIPSIDPTISLGTIHQELSDRFEIGENCIEAATHMDNRVEQKNNFEYVLIDFLYQSKHSKIYKNISNKVFGLF